MSAFEAWKDPETNVVFYFSYSNQDFTTGVMEIPPYTELPKHSRPKAFENLVQVSGSCVMHVFDENDVATEHILKAGDVLRMDKGQYHIHANPYGNSSYTLFKADGDITEIMSKIRETFERLL